MGRGSTSTSLAAGSLQSGAVDVEHHAAGFGTEAANERAHDACDRSNEFSHT